MTDTDTQNVPQEIRMHPWWQNHRTYVDALESRLAATEAKLVDVMRYHGCDCDSSVGHDDYCINTMFDRAEAALATLNARSRVYYEIDLTKALFAEKARAKDAEAALSEARAALEAIKGRAARLVELNCDHKWGDVYFGIKTPEPDETLVNYMWRCEYCGSIKLDHGVTIIRGDLEALPQNIYAKADDALRALSRPATETTS